MNRQFIYRAPGEGGEGGGGQSPSLADLGGGTDPGFELTPEEIAKKAADQVGIDGVPKTESLTDPDPNKKPDDPGDAAGKVETDEEKAAREAEEAKKDKTEDGDDDNDDDSGDGDGTDEDDFLGAVAKLRGDDFDSSIEYPEGLDPVSPEGIVFRDQQLEKHTVDRFERHLKETDPRGYAYLLHRQNGGSDEDFFSSKGFVLPDLNELKESVDLQREVYRQGLISQGNTEKQAKALVEMAIKDGELSAEAEAMHNKIKAAEDKALLEISKDLDKKNKEQAATLASFSSQLEKEITEGTNLKFIVPEADKGLFLDSVKQNIHYENGKFYLIKPLDKDNLTEQLQVELFGYLKGDLKKLVERKAKSLTTQRLKITKDNKPNPKGTGDRDTGGLTLGSI